MSDSMKVGISGALVALALTVGVIWLGWAGRDAAPQATAGPDAPETDRDSRPETPRAPASGPHEPDLDAIIGDDGVTLRMLQEQLADGEVELSPSAWLEGPVATRDIDEQVEGLNDAEEVAARFALALATWDYQQAERDRIEALRPLVADPVWRTLNAPADQWPVLDDTRAHSQETATALLSYIEPEGPRRGATGFRVQTVTSRESLYRSAQQRDTLTLWVRPVDGDWLVEDLQRSAG